jgi:DNA polymerase eta
MNMYVEKASIDEAFVDLTVPVRDLLLERYPVLHQPPADSLDGLDTPLPPPSAPLWEGLGHIVPINPPPPDDQEPIADTKSLHTIPDDVPTTWHDVALSIGAELMHGLRAEVRKQLGYTMSAVCALSVSSALYAQQSVIQGVSRNKFLAKVRKAEDG